MKPLSAQFADLSVRAKNAEDSVAKAQKETHDKLVAVKQRAHADVTTALARLDRDIKSAGDNVTGLWNSKGTCRDADKQSRELRQRPIRLRLGATCRGFLNLTLLCLLCVPRRTGSSELRVRLRRKRGLSVG